MLFLRRILQFLFPSHCVVCKQPSVVIHQECLGKCQLASETPYSWLVSCFAYRTPEMKKIIRYLKTHEDSVLAEYLAYYISKRLVQLLEINNDSTESLKLYNHSIKSLIICPVPASRERIRRNGFNQSSLLAWACTRFLSSDIIAHTRIINYNITPFEISTAHRNNSSFSIFRDKQPLYYENLCYRTREVKKQALIKHRFDRIKNPNGVFAVNKRYSDIIKNSTIIIVDDVTTTGATLADMRRAFLTTGASNVIAITVAH